MSSAHSDLWQPFDLKENLKNILNYKRGKILLDIREDF